MQQLDVRPRFNHVLIERRRVATAGLVLPEKLSESSKEAVFTFHVHSLGPGVQDTSILGKRVLMRPSGMAVMIPDGSGRALVLEDEVIAVVEEPACE
jgi:hypothetical protein